MILRLLADDLSGALDSAAQFVPPIGPIPAGWAPSAPKSSAAFDTGTRDANKATAQKIMQRQGFSP